MSDLVFIPQVARRKLQRIAFWNRFPDKNEMAMRAIIASGSPALLAGALRKLEARVDSVNGVELDNPSTVAGIRMLASDLIPETISIDGVTLPLRLKPEEVVAILGPSARLGEAYED